MEAAWNQRAPFIVEPSTRDARMVAQEGLFICSCLPPVANRSMSSPLRSWMRPSINAESFEELCSLAVQNGNAVSQGTLPQFGVISISIDVTLRRKMLPMLRDTFGTSLKTLYPDIEGFSMAVRAGLRTTGSRSVDRDTYVHEYIEGFS